MVDTPRDVAERYFAAVSARDLAAMGDCWAPDGVEHIAGLADAVGPEGVRAVFGELFGAFPDFALTPARLVADGEHVAVHWHATATFSGPDSFQGLRPTGARVQLEGLDLLEIRDGRIVRNDAYLDSAGLAEQLGALPPSGSRAERGMTAALNARTVAARQVAGGAAEPVADGVWLVRGGVPRLMNVYLLAEEGGGVCVFDAGARSMLPAVRAAAGALGGITRLVLGHAHADHRGCAAGLAADGIPVLCHPDEREAAEGDGGAHTFDLRRLPAVGRLAYPRLMAAWDGGPVRVSDTVTEGDEIAGFRVIHLPGHARGQIGLVRERDGLALTSDAFYTVDILTMRRGAPRIPHPAFTPDHATAVASLERLADLGLRAAWLGHADPVTGDVAGQLREAARRG